MLAWTIYISFLGALLLLLLPKGSTTLARGLALVFATAMLACGAAGEELLFRGYGFQIMLAEIGPFATILPVSVLFALLHGANPNANWYGIANTAGFGAVQKRQNTGPPALVPAGIATSAVYVARTPGLASGGSALIATSTTSTSAELP